MNRGGKEAGQQEREQDEDEKKKRIRMRIRIFTDKKINISSIAKKIEKALWGTFTMRICNELT